MGVQTVPLLSLSVLAGAKRGGGGVMTDPVTALDTLNEMIYDCRRIILLNQITILWF